MKAKTSRRALPLVCKGLDCGGDRAPASTLHTDSSFTIATCSCGLLASMSNHRDACSLNIGTIGITAEDTLTRS